jgi:hypothetical protein
VTSEMLTKGEGAELTFVPIGSAQPELQS